VSETTEEELQAYSGGPKPDLVQGIVPAYTLPAPDLAVSLVPLCFIVFVNLQHQYIIYVMMSSCSCQLSCALTAPSRLNLLFHLVCLLIHCFRLAHNCYLYLVFILF